MTTREKTNKATLASWYDNVWGKIDPDAMPAHIGPSYLRHDMTGANNTVTAEQYQALVSMGMQGEKVMEFSYFLMAEGDFVVTLGRYVLTKKRQWDWVQAFRLENGKLAETWLPGMGGKEPLAVPRPENAWTDGTVPVAGASTDTPAKTAVREFYENLGRGGSVEGTLTDTVRWHDIESADIVLEKSALQQRLLAMTQGDTASDMELFLIEEGSMIAAIGRWQLGSDKRQWDWVQAFRMEGDRIAESWITSIGGTDASIAHVPQRPWTFAAMPMGSVLAVVDY